MISSPLDFNKFKLSFFVLAAIVNLSMIAIRPEDILSEDDLILEVSERATPALSVAQDSVRYWESFNQWKCFSTDRVETYCAEIDDGQTSLPTLLVSDDHGALHEFSLDPGPDLNCEVTLHQWSEVLKNQRSFCAYAAYLQQLDANHELWIVDRIKSYRGVWSYRTNIDDSSEDF